MQSPPFPRVEGWSLDIGGFSRAAHLKKKSLRNTSNWVNPLKRDQDSGTKCGEFPFPFIPKLGSNLCLPKKEKKTSSQVHYRESSWKVRDRFTIGLLGIVGIFHLGGEINLQPTYTGVKGHHPLILSNY